jgi:hypothetical protein
MELRRVFPSPPPPPPPHRQSLDSHITLFFPNYSILELLYQMKTKDDFLNRLAPLKKDLVRVSSKYTKLYKFVIFNNDDMYIQYSTVSSASCYFWWFLRTKTRS